MMVKQPSILKKNTVIPQQTKKVHNINVHYIEEQYWLHWKDIAICFNANVYWDTDSYILNIQTQYLSPTDIQKAIDRARRISIEKPNK